MKYGKLIEGQIVYFRDSEIKLKTTIVEGKPTREILTDELRNQYLIDNNYKEVILTQRTAPDLEWVETETSLTHKWVGEPFKIVKGVIPVKPEKVVKEEPVVKLPTADKLRKKAYATEKVVLFEDKTLTVDQANQRFLQLLSEGKSTEILSALISESKNTIRLKYN